MIGNKSKGLIFKVDFKKTYDLVVWTYLDDTMRSVNFYWKWRKLIRGCI